MGKARRSASWMARCVALLLILLIQLKDTSAGECIPVSTDLNRFQCFSRSDTVIAEACTDATSECASWAATGECRRNPSYMLFQCKQSCNTCIDGHVGVTQIAPDGDSVSAVVERLGQTVQYLQREMVKARGAEWLKTCTNDDAHCTYWAVTGQCSTSPEVRDKCGAACQTCHVVQ